MKWAKRLLYVLILLLAAAAALPVLIPLNAYIPRIEKMAAESLHEPVRVRGLRAGLLPIPYLLLEGVSIGAAQDARIKSIKVSLDPLSLFRRVKVVERLVLDGASLPTGMLAGIPGWFSGGGGAQRVVIRRIELKGVTLAFEHARLGPIEGVIRLGARGGFEQALAKMEDGRLKLHVTPKGNDFLLKASARNWRLPLGPPLLFDALRIRAVAHQGRLDAEEISGRLYQGSVSGNATLSWKRNWKLKGRLQGRGIELRDIVPIFSRDTRVSGRLNADAVYAMDGRTAAQMMKKPRADVKFRVSDGVLHNLDLVAAVKTLTSQGVRGGQTRFDTLSGVAHISAGVCYFRKLRIASGLLAATGSMDISRAKRLSGRIDAQLKGTATLVGVPLALSGTLQEPVLRPSGAALAGAVAGTAVLGPGLGTGLGVKAGEFVEDIFK